MIPSQQNQHTDHKCDRRYVFFAGPPKTGSTAVQKFFKKKFRTFSRYGWTYPNVNRDICQHIREGGDGDEASAEERKRKIEDFVRKDLKKTRGGKNNLFVACDEFSNAPWIGARVSPFADILRWLDVDMECMEMVLHFRSPHVQHWHSAYQHAITTFQSGYAERTVKDYVCNQDEHYLLNAVDTFGKVSKYRNMRYFPRISATRLDFPVTVIDVGGVEKAGRDVSHVLACDVLGNFPCTDDGWISNIDKKSPKSPEWSVDLTDLQSSRIEKLFRALDCSYRDELVQDPKVKFVLNDTVWQDCKDGMDYRAQPFEQLRDYGFLQTQIRSIVGCEGSAEFADSLLTPRPKVVIQALPGNGNDSVQELEKVKDFIDESSMDGLLKMSNFLALPVLFVIYFSLSFRRKIAKRKL